MLRMAALPDRPGRRVGTALRRHECSSARVSGNDANENAGLSGRGERIGDRPLCPLAAEQEAFAPKLRRLGTERSVPNFSQALLFSRVRALQATAMIGVRQRPSICNDWDCYSRLTDC